MDGTRAVTITPKGQRTNFFESSQSDAQLVAGRCAIREFHGSASSYSLIGACITGGGLFEP